MMFEVSEEQRAANLNEIIRSCFHAAVKVAGVTLLEEMQGPVDLRPEGVLVAVSRGFRSEDYYGELLKEFQAYKPEYAAYYSAHEYLSLDEVGRQTVRVLIRYGTIKYGL